MITAALVLIYLAVFKEIEPVLLLPIGFGCLLANIPMAGMTAAEGKVPGVHTLEHTYAAVAEAAAVSARVCPRPYRCWTNKGATWAEPSMRRASSNTDAPGLTFASTSETETGGNSFQIFWFAPRSSFRRVIGCAWPAPVAGSGRGGSRRGRRW